MKRGTPDHPKIVDLATSLHLYEMDLPVEPEIIVIGLLEKLWHVTAKNTPDGGIGKYSNAVIAKTIGWPIRKADQLINALIETHWIDGNESCRLYIHAWHEHCDDSVHTTLAKEIKFFANGEMPKLSRLNSAERIEIERKYKELQESAKKRVEALPSAEKQNEALLSANKRVEAPCLSLSPCLGHSQGQSLLEKSEGERNANCPPPLEKPVSVLEMDLDFLAFKNPKLAEKLWHATEHRNVSQFFEAVTRAEDRFPVEVWTAGFEKVLLLRKPCSMKAVIDICEDEMKKLKPPRAVPVPVAAFPAQEPARQDEVFFQRLIETGISKEEVDDWFEDASIEYEDGLVIVLVPSGFRREYIETNFYNQIQTLWPDKEISIQIGRPRASPVGGYAA